MVDTYELAKKFKYFRTTDVVDALDAVGRQDITLMDERIKPLWQGIRFWGPAVTVRALPANIRMPVLSPEDAIRSHAIWVAQPGGLLVGRAVKNGWGGVTPTAGCPETGSWAPNSAPSPTGQAAVRALTNGYPR